MLRLVTVFGSSYLGVYCTANERYALVAEGAEPSFVKDIEEVLKVEVVRTYIAGSTLVGSLVALNSNGMVVTNFAEKQELAKLPKDLRVGVMEEKLNAAGNNIVANDKAAFVHPAASRFSLRAIEDALGVEVHRGSIAGMETVGSVCLATSKGVVCHPRTSEDELKMLSSLFGVPASVATLNYGTPYLGACAVANSKGACVGSRSTPIELGRLEDGLMLY
ncbi:MAG: Translation initiation factor 6 [Candidatus Thermoplasmatota archaeon]|nr:Translation initiation factor 6 [Candidatus Thermoplasmatota archaeon]